MNSLPIWSSVCVIAGSCQGLADAEKLSLPPSVSAGFDAAEGDELGECKVTPAAYAQMTHMLMGLAGGKVVVALEVRHDLPYQCGFRS